MERARRDRATYDQVSGGASDTHGSKAATSETCISARFAILVNERSSE